MTHKRVFDYTITIDRFALTLHKNTAAFTQHGHHYVFESIPGWIFQSRVTDFLMMIALSNSTHCSNVDTLVGYILALNVSHFGCILDVAVYKLWCYLVCTLQKCIKHWRYRVDQQCCSMTALVNHVHLKKTAKSKICKRVLFSTVIPLIVFSEMRFCTVLLC